MKNILLFTFMILLASVLLAEFIPFNPEHSYPKIVVVCFKRADIGNREGILDFEVTDGVVKTGITSFDNLAQQFRFVDLQQKHDFIKDLDWHKDGMYPRNIYRIILESNDNIEEALSALSQNPHILFAEYEQITKLDFIPDDPQYNMQWHHPVIESPQAWDYSWGSDEIIIGIVDAGIKWNHPDLQDNIWINEPELNSTSGGNPMTINWTSGTVSGGNGIDDDGNGKVDDCIGWNFYNNNNQSYQSLAANDHGTHVGGCAGAVGNNGVGVVGSTMNVKLISSRHAPTNIAFPYVQSPINGMYYCIDSGADVVNCSFGGTGNSYQYNLVADYAVSHGSLIIASAGNNASNNGTLPHYPSDATNAISVAATGQNDIIASFSNYGDPIDVSAPGVDIRSTVIGGSGYDNYQGTSMASPTVTGIAALIKSLHPGISGLDLKARLEMTCDNIDALNPGYEGWLGSGRVNSFQALMYDLIPKLVIEDFFFFEVSGDGDGIANPGETIDLTLMLQNASFSSGAWAAASGVYATMSCSAPGVTIINDTGNFPNINSGGSGWNAGEPFRFETDEYLSDMVIPFVITVYANQTNPDYPYEVSHDYDFNLSLSQAGWPFELGGATSSSALIIDINNDGENEVVFGDQTGLLHAVLSNGTEELPNFPIDFGANINAAVAVADINDDGYNDIIVGTQGNELAAVEYTGNILFTYDTGGQVKGNPMIADVDGNGILEIIVFTFSGSQAIILNADGTNYGNFPITLPGMTLASPTIADLDSDGYLDIITGIVTGMVYATSSNTGTDVPGWPYAAGGGAWNGPIVANIDGDEDPEVLIATLNGKLVVINHDATLNFEVQVGGQIKSSIVVGNLDNSGSLEIIFSNTLGELFVFDNQGNNFGIFPVNFGASTESTPILADMDNDGTLEIIFGDDDGYLHSIDITGNETGNFPLFLENSLKVSPAIGFADNDDDVEIAIANMTGYHLIDFKREIGDIGWQCFKNNPARTGNINYTLPTTEEIVPTYVTSLGNNYPNPFNPQTSINFSLKENSFVKLEIFNIKGQLIKTLISDTYEAGVHFTNWTGIDNSGKSIGSGIYLYKLETKDYSASRKMLLLK
ncbi:MAG: S8 family serine peptidase [Armatimonadetes bacterium]|nr:S8 family serine peptidase [Armatimonadota bacterium]